LEPFGPRAQVVHGAIWSGDQRLRVERGHFRDGLEWSFQVRRCREGEAGDVMGFSLETIYRRFQCGTVDLLKIDIERGELEVFSSACDFWLARTRNIAIELHGSDCEAVFRQALSGYEYRSGTSGELTLCRDLRVATSPRSRNAKDPHAHESSCPTA
jgi:hypothetical protein